MLAPPSFRKRIPPAPRADLRIHRDPPLMLKNLKVRTKLAVSFGSLAILALIVAVLSLESLAAANDRFVSFINGVNARSSLADDVHTAVDRRAIAARNLVLVTAPEDIAAEKAAVLQAHADVQARLAELNQRIDAD